MRQVEPEEHSPQGIRLEPVRHVAGDLEDDVRAARPIHRQQGLAAEKEAFATVFASEDAKEGIAAFLAKRAARFKGA